MRSRAVVAGFVAVLVACTGGLVACSADPLQPAPPPAPPPPPAACVLDEAALAALTGLEWTPDRTLASDTRCVYDPANAERTTFLAVELSEVGPEGPAAELRLVGQVCQTNRRSVPARDGGFVCRLRGGPVFGAAVAGDQMLTIAASAVPNGTTAQTLTDAVVAELARWAR